MIAPIFITIHSILLIFIPIAVSAYSPNIKNKFNNNYKTVIKIK